MIVTQGNGSVDSGCEALVLQYCQYCRMKKVINNLPPRWQNWFVRGQSGLLLISAFCSLISLGPLGLFGLTLVVQVSIEKYSVS